MLTTLPHSSKFFVHLEGTWKLKMETKSVQIGPKRCPRGSKLAPRGAQEAPSWVQEMAKSAQVKPKSSPRASKLSRKGSQKALEEQNGGIRRAFEGQNVRTSNYYDPTIHVKGFCCIRRALGRPKWNPSGAWKPVWRDKWSPSSAWRAVWQGQMEPRGIQEAPS